MTTLADAPARDAPAPRTGPVIYSAIVPRQTGTNFVITIPPTTANAILLVTVFEESATDQLATGTMSGTDTRLLVDDRIETDPGHRVELFESRDVGAGVTSLAFAMQTAPATIGAHVLELAAPTNGTGVVSALPGNYGTGPDAQAHSIAVCPGDVVLSIVASRGDVQPTTTPGFVDVGASAGFDTAYFIAAAPGDAGATWPTTTGAPWATLTRSYRTSVSLPCVAQ